MCKCNKANLRKMIDEKLDKIESPEVLENINEYLWDCLPETLREYIDRNFDSRCNQIKRALEEEVRSIWWKICEQGGLEVAPNCDDHWSCLYVKDLDLDIWIAERGPLFNSIEIAKIIYKIYKKEIILD